MTMAQEIRRINDKLDTLTHKFDSLIDLLTIQFKAELLAANDLHALEVAELLKQTYALKQEARMLEVDKYIKENKTIEKYA